MPVVLRRLFSTARLCLYPKRALKRDTAAINRQQIDWICRTAREPDVIRELANYMPPTSIWRLGPNYPHRAALDVLSRHRYLGNADILSSYRSLQTPRPMVEPEVNLLRLVSVLVGKRNDRHPYDIDLVRRLSRIALAGSPEAVRAAMYLICPIRNPRARRHTGKPPPVDNEGEVSAEGRILQPPKFLLVPDKDEARNFYTAAYSSNPSLASVFWAKRLLYVIQTTDNMNPQTRLAFCEQLRVNFETVYYDPTSDQGSRSVAAKELGNAYAFGVLPPSAEEARIWWERALPFGTVASSDAAFFLGSLYLGKQDFVQSTVVSSFEKNIRKGLDAYRIAAKVHKLAALQLGLHYYLDTRLPTTPTVKAHVATFGVEPDDKVAAYFFYQAALQGSIEGRIRYAEMLLLRRANPPNDMERQRTTEHWPDFADPDGDESPVADHSEGVLGDIPKIFVPRSRVDTLAFVRDLVAEFRDPAKGGFIHRVHWNSPIRSLEMYEDDARSGGEDLNVPSGASQATVQRST